MKNFALIAICFTIATMADGKIFAQTCSSSSLPDISLVSDIPAPPTGIDMCGTTVQQVISGIIKIDGSVPANNHPFNIIGLDICNPDAISSTNNGHCIELINCNNVTINHCYLHDAQSAAIKLYNCTNVTITENRIQDADFGILAVGNPKPKRKSQISKYK